jgi:hypothetical protein
MCPCVVFYIMGIVVFCLSLYSQSALSYSALHTVIKVTFCLLIFRHMWKMYSSCILMLFSCVLAH